MTAARATGLYGLMVEFGEPEALVAAAAAARRAGFSEARAYAPHAVDGLDEALGLRARSVAGTCLAGAVLGGLAGYFMQWYAFVVSYPINIGGRPLHSWPAFIPVSFELAVLLGAFGAVAAMFLRAGLPRLNHPVFNAPRFEFASRTRYFLSIDQGDPRFDPDAARAFFVSLGPLEIREVPA